MKLVKARPLRLPRLRPYRPAQGDPPIFWFNNDRDDIVADVVRRIVDARSRDESKLELVLNDTAYHEIARLEAQRDDETKSSLGFWRSLARRIARMSASEKKGALGSIAERMARDIAGNFDPRVYTLATRGAPRLIATVMKPSALPNVTVFRDLTEVDDLVRLEGQVEAVRALAKIGTLVMVPTHSSNLDSLALGYALMRELLPPVTYGAGKNLFTNPIVSFFMHNLGAYRLDRRIRATLYKDVLKTYSCVMIERGYHCLFFPGGTRSRSGRIEQKLKLGLAGSGVEAFARGQVQGTKRPVFFVPTTINYALVLEAETLIDDHLKEAGKARYIIDDDEFSRVERWVAFFKRLRGLEAACVIRFGTPLDPFGNEVDINGRSLRPGGGTVDPVTYVTRDGVPVLDSSRDAGYTKLLGDEIARAYLRETVVMETQLVAHCLFRTLVRATPGLDLFARLRHRGDVGIARTEVIAQIGDTRDRLMLLEREGRLRVSPTIREPNVQSILDRTLSVWSGYHIQPIALEQGGEITIENPTLLYYYANRLALFARELATPGYERAAEEILRATGIGR